MSDGAESVEAGSAEKDEFAIDGPEHLTGAHDVENFDCGVPALNDWLKNRAVANEGAGASRTYVVTRGGRVVGYYALATGAVEHSAAPGAVKRNMPNPVPVMILGRLAVDHTVQGRGVARGLLQDAILRTIQAAGIAGIRAILVHAISDEAKAFYIHNGFVESPIEPMTLMIRLVDANNTLSGNS